MSKISIIIPTYNEKENIPKLLKIIKDILRIHSIEAKILIIDDNSPDHTANGMQKEKREYGVRVFVRTKEKGLATAILYGIKKSKEDIVIGMDADFNHDPKIIPQLISGLRKADLVIASRFVKGGGMEEKLRYFFTYIFNIVLNKALGFPVMDNMSGFYAIKRKILFNLPLEYIYRGYGEYHLRLVYLAHKKGLKLMEVPVHYKKRVYGRSKSNLFQMFFVYLWEALILKFSKRYEI